MSFGGYTLSFTPYNSTTNSNYLILYAYEDNETLIGSIGPTPINPYSAMCITSNNTLLFAANTSNERNSWTLYNYRLPIVHLVFNGYYSNLEINYNVPEINSTVEPFNATTISITFNDPINLSESNLSIYHLTTGTLRQMVSGSMNGFFSAISGTLYLTPKATIRFLGLSRPERSAYFSNLISELANMVPVRSSRLSSNGNYQHIKNGTPLEQIFISIYVHKPMNSTERSVSGVFSDLDTMIRNKKITSISIGSITNDLDKNFGFENIHGKDIQLSVLLR
ncbi:17508_t:CDS:2 [Acaulospora colombiana]|uniref:17508_t:CDS:1 n=1 Tax=Acaulospora colombiana TaxID=27376 RepID=A0ACA9KPH3_9GLOM|nr:17508_t:CDS:2 [Acaulospora colombiana]